MMYLCRSVPVVQKLQLQLWTGSNHPLLQVYAKGTLPIDHIILLLVAVQAKVSSFLNCKIMPYTGSNVFYHCDAYLILFVM